MPDKVERIVQECLRRLRRRDHQLFQNDVSERAITHKLAEYLQVRFPRFHVDCEYNRNYELGEGGKKLLYLLKGARAQHLGVNIEEDELLETSTYPDIIVHRRLTNSHNLLIVEVKKRRSRIPNNYDHEKLIAFTEHTERNRYNFKHGVFILLGTGSDSDERPELTWFKDGRKCTM